MAKQRVGPQSTRKGCADVCVGHHRVKKPLGQGTQTQSLILGRVSAGKGFAAEVICAKGLARASPIVNVPRLQATASSDPIDWHEPQTRQSWPTCQRRTEPVDPLS